MYLKFVADDGCQIINEFSNVIMERIESEDFPDYKYSLCFINNADLFSINILCKSSTEAHGYMHCIYSDGKIDFSLNPDVKVTMSDMSGKLEDMLDILDDEDDYEYEDDD